MEIIFYKYFASIKIRGNLYKNFFKFINKMFNCLIGFFVQSCLKFWYIGKCIDIEKGLKFKYEIAIRKYNNLSYWKPT